MSHIIVIGAGISGVTTAYTLSELGYRVTVLDRHLYPAMETSFANGGQLSACNAEVWNSAGTIFKGLKWMLKRDAPLLVNPKPSWHKLAWLGEFVAAISRHRENTIETTRLAIAARQHLFEMAQKISSSTWSGEACTSITTRRRSRPLRRPTNCSPPADSSATP